MANNTQALKQFIQTLVEDQREWKVMVMRSNGTSYCRARYDTKEEAEHKMSVMTQKGNPHIRLWVEQENPPPPPPPDVDLKI
jgi:hypothetical protein